MSAPVSIKNLKDYVKDSNRQEDQRVFNYNLNDKQTRAKLVKGTKRDVFGIE